MKYAIAKPFTVAALLVASAAFANQPPAIVEAAVVTLENAAPTADLPGTVISTRDAQVRAEIEGRIDWIAPVGAEIAAGEPLARLDDQNLQLQLQRDNASIKRLTADIAVRERQQARLAQLAEDNNMAQVELDQVGADIEMLKQDLVMAKVAREQTRLNITRSKVPAPFGGIVVARTMSEGEYTTAGSTLVRLVDPTALEISVSAPLRVARFNKPGQKVDVLSDGERSLERLRSVVPVGDPQSRMMELRIDVGGQDRFIGEAVTVSLPQAAVENSLTIPRDALVLRDSEQFVYALNGEGAAEKVAVETTGGLGSRLSVDVLSGALEAGTRVVVRGAESLRDGQEVKVLETAVTAR